MMSLIFVASRLGACLIFGCWKLDLGCLVIGGWLKTSGHWPTLNDPVDPRVFGHLAWHRMVSHAWVENAKSFFEDVLKSMFRNEARALNSHHCATGEPLPNRMVRWGSVLNMTKTIGKWTPSLPATLGAA